MKRVHVISVGDPRLCELAIVLKSKGHEVTTSAMDIMEPVRGKLEKFDILPEQEGWFPEKLDKEYDFVVPANDVPSNNPELVRARELNLLVLSFPEYIFSRIKNKTRIMVSGKKGKRTIVEMMIYALRKNNLLFDYVVTDAEDDDIRSMSWSYDARMAILEDDDSTFSPFLKKQINEYYRPHILVMQDVRWEPSDAFPDKEEYINSLKRLIGSIERDGKLIYCEKDPELVSLAGIIREDLTGMPYKEHTIREDEEGIFLVSRFGEYKVNRKDSEFLEALNGARIACRQMGLKDQAFYEAISEYSFLK
ncbi:MAG: UDP-N-acetylmuramate--alanine ligase [Bacteroidales bacterium]